MKKILLSASTLALILIACSNHSAPTATTAQDQVPAPVKDDGTCSSQFIADWNLIATRSISLISTLSKANNDPNLQTSQADIQKVVNACAQFQKNNMLSATSASSDLGTPISCYAVQDQKQVEVESDTAMFMCTDSQSLLKTTTELKLAGTDPGDDRNTVLEQHWSSLVMKSSRTFS